MIPLMKNTFLQEMETKKALCEFIIQADHLSMNTRCAQFELAFAKFQSRRFAILFNSGGSANLALFQALKNLGRLKNNDRIGFSALTWSTNIMPILQMGMEPVPIDCEVTTLNSMSKNLLERLKTTSLKAFFITNALGLAGDLPKIKKICGERGIILLEDSCESLGSRLKNGVLTGNFGLAATFSFYVAHQMSTIEGGMVVTDDSELAKMLSIVRANGWDRNLSAENQYLLRKKNQINSEFQAKYSFYDLGFNFRPTEITGFLGLEQLKYLEENIKTRHANHLFFEKEIKKNPNLICLKRNHLQRVSGFALVILCQNSQLKDKYLDQFSGAGIEIRPVIAGNIQKQPFYKKYVKKYYSLPGADFIHNNGFYCGNYPELTESDKQIICSALKKY